MRKYLSVISMFVIVALLIGLGFYIRSRSTTSTPSSPDGSSSAGLPDATGQFAAWTPRPSTTGAAASSFRPTTDKAVENFFLGSSSTYYLEPDGKISAQNGSSSEILSSTPLRDISLSSFSADGGWLLVAYDSGAQWGLYDLNKRSWRPLEGGITSGAWSPKGACLVYYRAGGLWSLDLSPKDPKPQLLQNISLADIVLSWPSANTLLLSDRASAKLTGTILSFDLKEKTMSALVSQPGLLGLWNTDLSRSLLFQSTQERGGALYLANGDGDRLSALSFLTLPSKCLFDRNGTSSPEYLYCAIPSGSFSDKTLPDEYFKQSLFTDDDFYRIDLTTGELSPLLIAPAGTMDAEKLQIKNGRLYFRNRLDSKIYDFSLGS